MPEEPAHLRFFLVVSGQRVPVSPRAARLTLTREAGGDGAFYFRDKLSGPLSFVGEDFALLHALDNSRDRCQELAFLVESRAPGTTVWALEHRATFTCTECAFNLDRCTVEVTPTADDPHRAVLENWEKEVNILAMPGTRRVVTAQLAVLSQGLKIEFKRIENTEEKDYIGTDGWSKFLTHAAWIENVGRAKDTILFRYRLQARAMVLTPEGTYVPEDRSRDGWAPEFTSINTAVTPHTIDYVKAPQIAGFRPYVIGSFGDWSGRYGDQLVLRAPSSPAPAGYVELTGAGGLSFGEEVCGPRLFNIRRSRNDVNCFRLYWRFGEFRFTRGLPLLDALYYVAQQSLPADALDLLPPTPAQLSTFFSAPTNPATGATGPANEAPRLLLSAASDVKRYGASETATRVLISLKTLLDDLAALYDVGWYVDAATGWLRIEHRATLETPASGAPVDLRAYGVTLPAAYAYTADKLPRAEQLTISAALTEGTPENPTQRLYFAKDEITYTSPCVVTREGQNVSTRTASRLTGDVAGLVLSGDALPDNALALLAPDLNGALADANRAVSATELLRRYHRHGRVQRTGTVAGQPRAFASTRPGKRQDNLRVPLCSLALLTPDAQLTTNLGAGARLEKAVLDLRTGVATLAVLHPTPEPTTPGPVPAQRAFNDAFNEAFG